MKRKLIAVALGAAFAVSITGAASADPVVVPGVGTLTVDEGGYVVYADGNADNGLGPLTGYVAVTESGRVCADDNGSYGQSASETCSS